jgi:tetratricopeptide (TPR) repeat protein
MLAPGDALGPYRIRRCLGGGGMGVVYVADDPDGRPVALKTLGRADPSQAAALRREAAMLAHLRHPGIVAAAASGDHGDVPWLAMALVDGRPFGHPERGSATFAGTFALDGHDAPLAPGASIERASALPVLLRLCRVLSYLHGEGLVHADLKPDNVIVRADGQPVLVDFGLARRFNALASHEELDPRSIAGTPAYIAPELVRGEEIDARADLYALGCMLYEAVTGVPPLARSSVTRQLQAHLHERPLRPSALAAVDPALESVILGLLEKEPADRVGNAEVARAALLAAGVPEEPDPPPPGRPYLYRAGLVGQSDVIATVQAGLADGGLTVLRGPAGSGRTRLLAHLGESARDRSVLTVRCRGRADDLADLERFAGAEDLPDAPAARAARLVGRLAAGDGPVLVLVDDLGLADPVARALAAALTTPRKRLAAVATTPDDGPPGARVVPVPPLGTEAVHDMAAQMLGLRRVPAAFADDLAARSGGNPLVVAEILRAAVAAGLLALDTRGRWTVQGAGELRVLPTPASLRELVAGRLDGLSEAERAVVHAAAILGRALPAAWLDAMVDADPAASLAILVARQVLEDAPGGWLRFASAVIRDVVAEEIPPDERRALHVRAARAVDDPGEGAAHLAGAGDTAAAWDAWQEASRVALARNANGDVARMLRQALDLPGIAPSARAEARVALARACAAQSENAEAEDVAALAAAEADSDELRVTANVIAGRAALQIGSYARATAWFDRAIDVALAAGLRLRAADAEVWRSTVERRIGRFDEATRWLEAARGHAPDWVDVLVCQGELAGSQGRWDEAARCFRAALPRLGATSTLAPLINLAVAMRALGDPAAAIALLDEAAVRATGLGRVGMLAQIGLQRGLIELDRGNLDAAQASMAGAVAAARRYGERRLEGVALANLAEVSRQAGDRQAAEFRFVAALEIHREVGNRTFEAWTLGALGLVALDDGDLDRAASRSHEALAIQRAIDDVPEQARTLVQLARIARVGGDPAARDRLDEATALAGNAESSVLVAIACERGHLALVAGGDPGVALADARALAASAGDTGEVAATLQALERAVAAPTGTLVNGQVAADLPARLRPTS